MNFKHLSLLFLFWIASQAVFSQIITVMTYNIRYDNPGDSLNQWSLRKAWLCEQIKGVNPEIFGIQEGLERQVVYIDSSFKDYRHIGVGRDDGKTKGEYSAIWYNFSKVKLQKQGTFWLSPTPEKVSKGWDAALERICTFGLFRNLANGKLFWVFNTHFDHIGVEARKNSAILVLEQIAKMNLPGFPVILMGDFNSTVKDDGIKRILEKFTDSKSADKSMTMGPDGTFNDFNSKKPATERIDFIFTGYDAKPLDYRVIREVKDGRYASDHFPVISRVMLH